MGVARLAEGGDVVGALPVIVDAELDEGVKLEDDVELEEAVELEAAS